MGKKKVFSVTQVVRKPTLFQTAVPFDITLNGQIIATVVTPSGEWYECENCGENTQNIIEFKDKQLKWQKLTLCDKCSDKLL
jgi:hypothetical protein